MTKVVYLGTTYDCSACKCQEYLLKEALKDRPDIDLIVCDYSDLPDWIQSQVSLTDFPITLFIGGEVVEHYIIGTKSVSKLKALIEDIGF